MTDRPDDIEWLIGELLGSRFPGHEALAVKAAAALRRLAGEAEYWNRTVNFERARADNAEAERDRLRKLVKDAYNEGFTQGMREHTSSRGGIPWSDSAIRAALDRSQP